MNVLEAILARRSIREYTSQPVEREKLRTLLEAATAAPSGMNARPWEFVVIDDPGCLQDVRQQLSSQYNAPAAIVVCGHPVDDGGRRYWVLDCAAATENILLAALELGLGTCWIAVYPNEDRIASISRVLSLPEDVTPLNVIYVGYPAEEKEARTQYDDSQVFWQRYQK
jgi:nitroreductase